MTPRKLLLIAGAAMILTTNAVLLAGVAYNRSGTPESRMVLSEREFVWPRGDDSESENSGLSLPLAWRVSMDETQASTPKEDGLGINPAWLNEQRLAELGFKRGGATGDRPLGVDHLLMSERGVLLVLELAGSTWQQALQRAEQRVARQASLREANPDSEELAAEEKKARREWAREAHEKSRLFAVDAGADLASLRTRYPDKSRYLILPAILHVYGVAGRQGLTRQIQLRANQLHVPHALRGLLPSPPAAKPSFTATVTVGRKLEPWIEAVTRR